MTALLHRRAVTETTMGHFARRPFDWRTGATCVHLVRKQLVGLGHQPSPVKPFRSALSAKRALDAKGWASLSAMMDSLVQRIAPAHVILGDVVEMPSEDKTFGALAVVIGNGRIMGYLGGTDMLTIAQPNAVPLAAWRT